MSEPYRARSGLPVHIEDAGAGPAVLAVHGLGGGAWFFTGLARRLEGRFRVLSVDLPGTGRSVEPAPARPAFTADTWVADLRGLIEDRVGGPVVLLGHSMGTILALLAWDSWPELIRGLVFVGGLPEALPPIRERLRQRVMHVAAHGMAGTGALVSLANFSSSTRENQPELVAMFERLFEAQEPVAYMRSCEILQSISATSILPRVQAPCLALTGRHDQYAPPDLVSAFVQQLPSTHAEVVLPDAGHFPFLETPEPFAAALAPFLESVC